MEYYFDLPKGRVFYRKMGRGARTLIAFHGFADEGALFAPFAESMSDYYTIYAIDLPFHGQTEWKGDLYKPADINRIITLILERVNCLSYDLMGYSLGGTIILSMMGNFIESPERLLLLAPGGVKVRGLSGLSLVPLWAKKVIYRMTKNPNWLIALASLLNRIGLLHSFYIRYIKAHFREPQKRKRLLYTWYSLSFFRVDLQKVIEETEKKEIPVIIVLGSRDKIIDGVVVKNTFEHQKYFTILEVDNNHLMLNERVAGVLSDFLLE